MAVLVRGSFVDGVLDEDRLGDTLFKLVEATDAESAYQRARELGEASADDYTDDDGRTLRLQFLGFADLREITAEAIGNGVEVYSELIPAKPSRRIVDKERLTAFETDEEPDDFDRNEAGQEADARFSSDAPIR
jgi:hypothetical protein